MPQIIVTANGHPERHDRAVLFAERVTARDFESQHFQAQLVERISWAVGDAQVLEERDSVAELGSDSEPSRPEHDEPDRQRRSASVLTTAS